MATTYAYAKKYGYEFNAPYNWVYSNYFPKVPCLIYPFKGYGVHYHETKHSYQVIPYMGETNVVLNGFFQSEKYFAQYRDEIIDLLGVNVPESEIKPCISVHIRLGDYLDHQDKFPVVTKEYFENAITQYIKATGDIYEFRGSCVLYSDDIILAKKMCQDWLREYFLYSLYNISIGYHKDYENRNEIEDFTDMIKCKYHVISNSTFSWWAAWLSNAEGKIVISPSKDNWYGKGNSHLSTEDIIPNNWIQIKY